jgi:soluble lytic murein transglycosylase-like protein
MRSFILAIAAIAIAQPALARDSSHKSHHIKRHHHAAHSGKHHVKHHRKVRRVVRVQSPIESGYAMPKSFAEVQSFARTDATDTPFNARSVPGTTSARTAMQPTFAALAPRRIARAAPARDGALDAMIARHAAANGLPVDLVHRVVIRESRYNPAARNGSNLGLMQIKHATARGVGYTGSASGLFDAETNLTYAVRYLAGAYRAAGGNPNRAVAYYASGYHGRGVARAPVVTAQASSSPQVQAVPVALRDTDMVAYAPARPRVRRR